MTRFVAAYTKACSGQTLNYTANGSGAGISGFLAGKTDFGGSDTPLSGRRRIAAWRSSIGRTVDAITAVGAPNPQ